MSKFIAFCLLAVVCLVFITVGCGFVQSGSGDGTHTGYVTVRKTDNHGCFYSSNGWTICNGGVDGRHYEFIRPNGEIFEMNFVGLMDSPELHVGDTLKDLVYTDLKDHKQFFVKAVLDHEATNGTGNIILTQSTSALAYGACGTTAEAKKPTKKAPKPATSDARVVYVTSK